MGVVEPHFEVYQCTSEISRFGVYDPLTGRIWISRSPTELVCFNESAVYGDVYRNFFTTGDRVKYWERFFPVTTNEEYLWE